VSIAFERLNFALQTFRGRQRLRDAFERLAQELFGLLTKRKSKVRERHNLEPRIATVEKDFSRRLGRSWWKFIASVSSKRAA